MLPTVYIRFAARGPASPQRSPLLERLIARACASHPVTDWRAEAFHALASEVTSVPPIAAAALHASGGVMAGKWVCVATPVHLLAGMASVTMPDDGILDVSRSDIEALAVDFNRTFGDRDVHLRVARSGVLLCAFDEALQVTTHDPEDIAGRDVFSFQAAGADARRLRRLMNEMEMWLFDHDVNRTRVAHALPPITSLWLWGGGVIPPAMPMVHGWTAGGDPLFASFSVETEFPRGTSCGVVVCKERPGSAAWLDMERRWLAPAMARLRSGRIDRLELSAGSRCFTIGKGYRRRFWRRSRPWWESFGVEDK